jgi:hypothetical protein
VEFPFSDFQTYKRRPGLVLVSGEVLSADPGFAGGPLRRGSEASYAEASFADDADGGMKAEAFLRLAAWRAAA